MTPEKLLEFHDAGFVRIDGAVDTAQTDAMRERLWRRLEHRGARRDDPATWTPETTYKLQSVRTSDPAPHDSPIVCAALDAVFGESAVRESAVREPKWRTKPNWGQALVTFPTPEPWVLPSRPWHLDYPYTFPRDRVWGANVFLFVADCELFGGGTLVVQGSHRLVERFVTSGRRLDLPMKTLRRAFDDHHAWFRALTDRQDTSDDRTARFCDTDSDVHGIQVRVEQLTGRAGDVVVCHPWMIHNIAPNVRAAPRMMRATRVYHRDFLAEVGVIPPD